MPLSLQEEVLCECLEKGEPVPSVAAFVNKPTRSTILGSAESRLRAFFATSPCRNDPTGNGATQGDA
jgi:hypothetical protein